MPASLLLASVNSVNSTHIGPTLTTSTQRLSCVCVAYDMVKHAKYIAVNHSLISWSATFCSCQMYWLLVKSCKMYCSVLPAQPKHSTADRHKLPFVNVESLSNICCGVVQLCSIWSSISCWRRRFVRWLFGYFHQVSNIVLELPEVHQHRQLHLRSHIFQLSCACCVLCPC